MTKEKHIEPKKKKVSYMIMTIIEHATLVL